MPAAPRGTNLKKAKGAAMAQKMVPLPVHAQKPNGSETVVAQTKIEHDQSEENQLQVQTQPSQ